MDRLRDKVAFITGSGSGIGSAAAVLFSSEGAKVAVAEISKSSGGETASFIKDHGGKAIFIETDVKDPESIKNAIEKTVHEFGKLDILYNNAGYSVAGDGPVTDVSLEQWDETQFINLRGSFLCCKYGIPELIKNGGGSILLTGSIFGMSGSERSAYTAAKGGIISLTRVMAVDYGRYNIRVNCICPGVILTKAIQNQLKKFPHVADALRPSHLLGFGEPRDVAHMALYLASDESRIVTGTIMSVDSGFTAVGRNMLDAR
jgi:NAD(P)-dependent dehydrogenase (short-subunit alcohol dehydrogenase family)